MAKATIKEVEVVKMAKVKEKVGVNLELTSQEANVLFAILGRVTGGFTVSIYNELEKICPSYDKTKTFPEYFIIRLSTNPYITEYSNQPLK